jgi:hypothetical protein
VDTYGATNKEVLQLRPSALGLKAFLWLAIAEAVWFLWLAIAETVACCAWQLRV